MPLFKSRQVEMADAVRVRLHEAQTALSALEAERNERVVDWSTSGDDTALNAVQERIRRQKDLIEAIGLSLGSIEAKERQRIAEVKAAARKSEIRSAEHFAGSLVKAATRYREAVAGMVDAYREMFRSADKIDRLMSPREMQVWAGFRGLRPMLEEHAKLELARVGVPRSDDNQSPRFPIPVAWGSFASIMPYGRGMHEMPGIDDLLREKFSKIGAFLAHEKIDPPPPAPVEVAPDHLAGEVDHAAAAAAAAVNEVDQQHLRALAAIEARRNGDPIDPVFTPAEATRSVELANAESIIAKPAGHTAEEIVTAKSVVEQTGEVDRRQILNERAAEDAARQSGARAVADATLSLVKKVRTPPVRGSAAVGIGTLAARMRGSN